MCCGEARKAPSDTLSTKIVVAKAGQFSIDRLARNIDTAKIFTRGRHEDMIVYKLVVLRKRKQSSTTCRRVEHGRVRER